MHIPLLIAPRGQGGLFVLFTVMFPAPGIVSGSWLAWKQFFKEWNAYRLNSRITEKDFQVASSYKTHGILYRNTHLKQRTSENLK